MINKVITILMATYNGEKYVSHQLNSIINQTYGNWQLLIRDDSSKDNTPAIIETYKNNYPGKIEVLDNQGKNAGSLHNFSALFEAAKEATYIMFCDQDDEWKQDKTEVLYAKMQALEKQYGTGCPILIFTNFQYVDDNMNVIESKKNFEINKIKDFGFPQLLAQNPVYGCTTMMNKALADKVGAIPPEADYHDHWVALVAAAFGKLHYLDEKTVLYRQHGSNVSGSFDNNSFRKRIQRILVNKKNFAEAKAKHTMLLAFKKKYGDALTKKQKNILDDLLCFYNRKSFRCLLRSIGNKVKSQTLAQSVLLYATILFTKPSSVSNSL